MMLNIKFEQKVTFPVTWVDGLHYAGNIIHSPVMITRCSSSLSETKCLKNINLTGSTLSKLFKWWWPLTCSHLLPSILFKHKVFHHGKTKCPCRGGERCDFNPAELCQGDEFAKAKQIFGALNLDVWQRQCARWRSVRQRPGPKGLLCLAED